MKLSAKEQHANDVARKRRANELLEQAESIDYYRRDSLEGVAKAINRLTIAVLLAADLIEFQKPVD